MVTIGILGATGYTARELIRILLDHPEAKITALSSRQDESVPVHVVHPLLFGRLDLACENLTPSEVARRAEFAFCALPYGAAMAAVPELLAGGAKVCDLSADYRLADPAVYEQWYHLVHTDPTRLGATVYGLPELWADRIAGQELIANPGCYTSTAILGLAPLLCGGWIEPAGIIVDAKSGVSGAGRAPKLNTLFSECNESVSAYSVGNHRHTPEIDLILSEASGQEVQVVFTPHLMPMDRGILCTMYARPQKQADEGELLEAMRSFYEAGPFVRVVEHLPATKDVTGTNYCDITVRTSRGRVIVLSVTDNLIKGAAGVAVQNFNLMCGFPMATGLLR